MDRSSRYIFLPKFGDVLSNERHELTGTPCTKTKLLGEGCFGKVYLGVFSDGRQIAAKQVTLSAESAPQLMSIVKQVSKEMAILESVTGDHQNIVRYLGWSMSPRSKSIYFLMQYIEGPTLDSYVKQLDRLMSEDEIRVITRQLLSALVFVHSKGIVHKDVKPDNIIIRSCDNVVKLIDFGIAAVCGHRREAIGPAAFSAPEIVDQSLPLGTKCDSFSLGITVYFMATKSHPLVDAIPPFMLARMPQMLQLMMTSEEPLPEMSSSKFSSGLCSFYKRSTAKHPNNRASCSELLFYSEFITERKMRQDKSGCNIL